ncbi:hypothetical protein ACJZ2D_006342 [Fusarium nematophilum]
MFLDHGANPRVKLWLDSVNLISPFTLFVFAAFDIDCNERAEERYFQSLSSFIHGGADFDKADDSGPSFRSDGLQATLVDAAEETTGERHNIFFDRLEEKLRLIDKTRNVSQRRFVARLIREILPCAKESCWPLERYQRLIDRALRVQDPSLPSCIKSPATCLKGDNTSLGFDDGGGEPKRNCVGNIEAGVDAQFVDPACISKG